MDEQHSFASKTYKRAENNLREKLKPAFLKQYPHYMVPGFNLNHESSVESWDIENVISQYQDFPYHCDLPRPLLPPAKLHRAVIDEEDSALQLLAIKSHMDDDIARLKHYYNRHKKEFGVVHKKDIKWDHSKSRVQAMVPRYIADIAEIIEMDPDPYFKGAYNWYHTGGSLDYIHHNNSHALIFPFMGELVVTPLKTIDEFLWKPLLENASKCKLDDTVYELRHNVVGNLCRLLGRHKNYCTFYTLLEHDNKYNLNEIHQQKSKVPYVGADLSSIDINQYCTVNAERAVTLWDLNKVKHISSFEVLGSKVLDDCWGSVRFDPVDPHLILFMDRCCLNYLDVRISFDLPALKICPKSHLEKCEGLSLDVASRHNSCTYMGTYHSLLLCDNRSPKQCVQQKWTHQFKSPPIMATVTNREEKEIVVLSSQIAGESKIILNSWISDEISHSFNLPFTPPHITETLNESQMQGLCLNRYLRHRFELCNIGSQIIANQTGDVFHFLQNSVGDIYYQCITHDNILNKYSDINCKACCILDSWENSLSAQNRTIVPLTISGKANMQNAYESLTNTKLVVKWEEDKRNNNIQPSWKQSIDKLESYVDILAPELLAIWDVCEDVPVPLSAAPHQKVLSWLESSNTKAMFQSQEETDELQTPVNTQELISVSQEADLTGLDDSNVLQELLLPKVRTKPVRKKKRQK